MSKWIQGALVCLLAFPLVGHAGANDQVTYADIMVSVNQARSERAARTAPREYEYNETTGWSEQEGTNQPQTNYWDEPQDTEQSSAGSGGGSSGGGGGSSNIWGF